MLKFDLSNSSSHTSNYVNHLLSTIYRSSSVTHQKAFTIVELLVVIVAIGILAAITIVSYTGISQRAIAVSLKSDLTSAAKQIELYRIINDVYPSFNECPTPANANICLKPSSGNAYTYASNNAVNPPTFSLTDTNTNSVAYVITQATTPTLVVAATCPAAGFIPVPGSATYGTSDFCVMKYEAKNVGGIATSQASGTPWVNINWTSAITTAVAACSGCHLITEAEWMTIAKNVLSVSSNWSGGSVGSGYIYSGHNDNSPNGSQAADTNDANGYYNTGNVTPSSQRRTLTLSNGEVIWDLAGNVWEWTAGQTISGQPGIANNGWAWREWTAITTPGTLSPNPSPIATGITGASSWNSSNGIGQIYSNADEVDPNSRSFIRGGHSWNGVSAGVLSLSLINFPFASADPYMGLRVTR